VIVGSARFSSDGNDRIQLRVTDGRAARVEGQLTCRFERGMVDREGLAVDRMHLGTQQIAPGEDRRVIEAAVLDLGEKRAIPFAHEPEPMRELSMGMDARLHAVRDGGDLSGQRQSEEHGAGDLVRALRPEETDSDGGARERDQQQLTDLDPEGQRRHALGRARVGRVVLNDEAEIEAEMFDDVEREHRWG
jgi:hypothetical protein